MPDEIKYGPCANQENTDPIKGIQEENVSIEDILDYQLTLMIQMNAVYLTTVNKHLKLLAMIFQRR